MPFEIPWDWRIGYGGFSHRPDIRDGIRYFHAHDVNNMSACDVSIGLMESIQEPSEGSPFCPDCIKFVKENPAGRDKYIFY